MSIEIKVPALPESVTDATLVAWHKKAGESVRRDENLVDLETDKVVLEVPAPADGVLQEIKVEDGATVTAGDVLAVLAEGEVAEEEAAEPAEAAEHEEKAKKFVEDKLTLQAVEDYLVNEIERERSIEKLGETDATFMLNGWIRFSKRLMFF